MIRTRLSPFFLLASGLLLLAPGAIRAQNTAVLEPETASRFEFPLTIQSIMRGPELVGLSPSRIRWTDDSEWVYFRWSPGGGSMERQCGAVPGAGQGRGTPEAV